MKPTMLKSHAKLIFKFALIGVFSALLAGCGGQDTANPKSYDTYGPIITLNSAGADAIVETNSGSLLIPRENICYEIIDVCEDATSHYSDFIHYTAFEDGIEVFKSLEGMIIGYSEEHSHGNDYTDPSAIARDVYDGHVDVATELGGPVTGNSDDVQVIPVGQAIGIYTFTYTAKDESGNTATLKRVVNVVDTDAPVIALVGGSAIILGEGSDFADPGANATDNIDGEMNIDEEFISYKQLLSNGQQIDVEGISTDFLAEYEATYQFEDSSGNTASVTRWIIVAPPEGEIIDIIKDGTKGAT